MRAFIIRVFFVVIFFIGLGAVAENVSLHFLPEEKEIISLTEIPPPEIRVVRLSQPRKIIVRTLPAPGAGDCRMKIGPIMPGQVERPAEFVWEERISQ